MDAVGLTPGYARVFQSDVELPHVEEFKENYQQKHYGVDSEYYDGVQVQFERLHEC